VRVFAALMALRRKRRGERKNPMTRVIGFAGEQYLLR